MDVMNRPLNVLLLCDYRTDTAATVTDHIDSLRFKSAHNVRMLSVLGNWPWSLRLGAFDAVVIHTDSAVSAKVADGRVSSAKDDEIGSQRQDGLEVGVPQAADLGDVREFGRVGAEAADADHGGADTESADDLSRVGG